MTRRNPTPLVIAGVVLVLGALTTLSLFDAVLVAVVAYLLTLAGTVTAVARPDPWRPAAREETDGTRTEVSALTWTFFGRSDRVSEAAVRRLRVDATRRLARNGVVVPGGLGPRTPHEADPEVCEQARALLGDRTWATLTAPGGLMPSILDIAHCVDVIERLAPTPSHPVPPEGTS